jgi:hypothetical protein
LEFTSFTESYDRASNEPVLQVVIGLHRNEKHLQIHIHKDNHFVVGKVSSGKPAYMAAQALDAVEKALAIS